METVEDKKIVDEIIKSIPKKEGDPSFEEEEEVDSVEVAAEEMISAVKAGDAKGVAAAIRSAFELLQSAEE